MLSRLEAIVIPVKPTSLAKGRLSRDLSSEDRRRLTLVMLDRVIEVATDRFLTVVVTSDSEATEIAVRYGCVTEPDPGGGLNRAAESGTRKASELGATSVMLLHADLPFLDGAALTEMFSAETDVAVGIAKDGGTNALVMSPPGCIPFRYGRSSAAAHELEASSRRLSYTTIRNPRITFDVDDWFDLQIMASATFDDSESPIKQVASEMVARYSSVGG